MGAFLPVALAAGKGLFDFLGNRKKERAAHQDSINSPSSQLRNALIRAIVQQYNLSGALGAPNLAQQLTAPQRFRGSQGGFDLFNSLLSSLKYYQKPGSKPGAFGSGGGTGGGGYG